MAPNSIGPGPCRGGGGGGFTTLYYYRYCQGYYYRRCGCLTTTVITSISQMRIMPYLHTQPATLPLTKDEVVLKGPTFIHQALSPL